MFFFNLYLGDATAEVAGDELRDSEVPTSADLRRQHLQTEFAGRNSSLGKP